jgi:hypothetical protein
MEFAVDIALVKQTEVVPPEMLIELRVKSLDESLTNECPVVYPSRRAPAPEEEGQ